jgi:hypothetical protein
MSWMVNDEGRGRGGLVSTWPTHKEPVSDLREVLVFPVVPPPDTRCLFPVLIHNPSRIVRVVRVKVHCVELSRAAHASTFTFPRTGVTRSPNKIRLRCPPQHG